MWAFTWYIYAFLLVATFHTATKHIFAAIFCIWAWYFNRFQQLLHSPTTIVPNGHWTHRTFVPKFATTFRASNMPILTLNCHLITKKVIKLDLSLHGASNQTIKKSTLERLACWSSQIENQRNIQKKVANNQRELPPFLLKGREEVNSSSFSYWLPLNYSNHIKHYQWTMTFFLSFFFEKLTWIIMWGHHHTIVLQKKTSIQI